MLVPFRKNLRKGGGRQREKDSRGSGKDKEQTVFRKLREPSKF